MAAEIKLRAERRAGELVEKVVQYDQDGGREPFRELVAVAREPKKAQGRGGMVFETIDCPDCDGPAIVGSGGNGNCSNCHGTDYEPAILAAFGESLAAQSQDCPVCAGTGKCQTCYGKGYLNI